MEQKAPQTEHLSNEVCEFAAQLGIDDRLDALWEMTQELFPGPVQVEVDADPEWPDDRYIVFVVEMAGEPREILDREWEWHQQVHKLASEYLNTLRISITPR